VGRPKHHFRHGQFTPACNDHWSRKRERYQRIADGPALAEPTGLGCPSAERVPERRYSELALFLAARPSEVSAKLPASGYRKSTTRFRKSCSASRDVCAGFGCGTKARNGKWPGEYRAISRLRPGIRKSIRPHPEAPRVCKREEQTPQSCDVDCGRNGGRSLENDYCWNLQQPSME
jgi:hypothetical protein